MTGQGTSRNPTLIAEDLEASRIDGGWSRVVLGANDCPQRDLYRWGLAASGWIGLLVGVLADLGAGFVVTAIGYAAFAVAARLPSRTGDPQ